MGARTPRRTPLERGKVRHLGAFPYVLRRPLAVDRSRQLPRRVPVPERGGKPAVAHVVVGAKLREAQERSWDPHGRKAGVARRWKRAAVVHRRAHRDPGRHLVVEETPDARAHELLETLIKNVIRVVTRRVEGAGKATLEDGSDRLHLAVVAR